MASNWISEEVWRDALWNAREQLRHMKAQDGHPIQIAHRRAQVERIRSSGHPDWQERIE